ncbi:MAG TPA: hypothetical protein VMF31_03300 [Solirubrobacterales bacterium]|nr:hypothetical protein [Solirubrobacterales bacterium]
MRVIAPHPISTDAGQPVAPTEEVLLPAEEATRLIAGGLAVEVQKVENDLKNIRRAKANEIAENLGIESPESLKNVGEVVDAIRAARTAAKHAGGSTPTQILTNNPAEGSATTDEKEARDAAAGK